MDFETFSIEDQEAASAVATLGGKRDREDAADTAGGIKMPRMEHPVPDVPTERSPPGSQELEFLPYPFFYYRDYSTAEDSDPLTPLTPPGRVPNFPAKMHSILSRADLADVIAWMPHGRSWRVLKPREFEVRVIPTYFEHTKFSSFIRQANGWGFRRITQGRDRNSYYHPLFLRGIPHLCKQMKRPGVSEKQAADPDHEPDLYKINELHPVPEKPDEHSILLQATLQAGPKARMPIYSGSLLSSSSSGRHMGPVTNSNMHLTPRDQQAIDAFQRSLGASESQLNMLTAAGSMLSSQPVSLPESNLLAPAPLSLPTTPDHSKVSPLVLANQLAFANRDVQAALEASSAASQFAAGFAAATALSHQQFQTMLKSLTGTAPSGAAGTTTATSTTEMNRPQATTTEDSSTKMPAAPQGNTFMSGGL